MKPFKLRFRCPVSGIEIDRTYSYSGRNECGLRNRNSRSSWIRRARLFAVKSEGLQYLKRLE